LISLFLPFLRELLLLALQERHLHRAKRIQDQTRGFKAGHFDAHFQAPMDAFGSCNCFAIDESLFLTIQSGRVILLFWVFFFSGGGKKPFWAFFFPQRGGPPKKRFCLSGSDWDKKEPIMGCVEVL